MRFADFKNAAHVREHKPRGAVPIGHANRHALIRAGCSRSLTLRRAAVVWCGGGAREGYMQGLPAREAGDRPPERGDLGHYVRHHVGGFSGGAGGVGAGGAGV